MIFLENLNPNQRDAVQHTEGPLLILAGAGSGKTRVITYRIAYLIKEMQVSPYNIMAVTFTNKAAEEMRKRVKSLIGDIGESVFIKTFHSAAVYILRRFGDRIGVPKGFTIYDQADQSSLIKDILIDMRLDPKKIKPFNIANKISQIKDKVESLEAASDHAIRSQSLPYNFPEIYDTYHERLKINYALDFNDLLLKTVELLKDHEDVLLELQQRWRYFMIDEYQDTNRAQYLISNYLSSASRNLCVVGDDDQSIYSWRGADIRNILNFEKDYKEARVIVLEENYRSATPILDAASFVIKNNVNRKKKNIIAARGDGESVSWCKVNNEYGEAEFVINTITKLKDHEGLKNKDFTIFYRTNAQSRVFEDYLRRENILYKVIGGLRFYDRKEIKDILAYLRVISNPYDTISLLRIINTPSRGIGTVTLNRIKDISNEEGISYWDVIDRQLPIAGKAQKGIDEFRELIRNGIDSAKDIPGTVLLSDFITDIIENSGYSNYLKEEDSIDSRSRLENIDEFINSVYDYEQSNIDVNLEDFIQGTSLLTSQEDPVNPDVDDTGYVSLMTVHNAKGLEFPVVFLTGMEDGIFPHINSTETKEGLEEERRLCYVGITRAMDRVYITSADIRRQYFGVDYKIPSRFIKEIPQELLDITDYRDNGSFSGSNRGNWESDTPKHIDRTTSLQKDITNDFGSEYRMNERVIHPKFGSGQITEIKGKGDNIKLAIKFSNGEKKIFLEKYTPLEKLI
ncbi:MAG: UvrD-helicase domain-containing protein [Spirochaetota bacterium]|nr:UvrD-helicase domain-containing protein [Spirochaetota bacterium]